MTEHAALDLTDRVIIVTGASSGIGEATARLLHQSGARPVLAARRADRLSELSDELAGALAVPTDVTDPSQLHALVDAVVARHGRIDGLVNNAGASFHGPLEEIDLAGYLDLLQLNVVSVVAAIQAVQRREAPIRRSADEKMTLATVTPLSARLDKIGRSGATRADTHP